MKKRILALVIALLLLAGVSVVGTSAAARYSIWVGGVQVTSDNASDVLRDGTVRYVAKENCLYLKNANIRGEVLVEDVMSAGIYAGGMDLTVSFSGDNKIVDAGGYEWSMGVGVEEGNLTLVPEGDSATLEIYSGYADSYSTGIYATYNYDDVTQGGILYVEGGNITVGYAGKKLSEGTGVGIYSCGLDMKSGNVETVGGASESGDSLGAKVYGIVSVKDGNLVAKGSEGVSSIGLYSEIVYFYDEEFDEYVSTGGGYLYLYEDASVTAEASKAQMHSFGMSLSLGMSCWGNLVATGADTTTPPGPDVTTTSYGIVVWDVTALVYKGGEVFAKAGYAYDSCGMNLITQTEDAVALKYIYIKDTDVTAISTGGYMYSDGMYAGIEKLELVSGSLTVYGGPVTAESEYYPESGAIFAEGNIYINGGVLKASCAEVTQEEGSDITIYTTGEIDVDNDMEIKHGKLVNGVEVSYIMQDSFDVPLIIAAKGYVELGDVNFDGDINIKDATAIQKHLALLEVFGDEAFALADFNEDGGVSIKDATAIQKYIAGLDY